MSQFLREKEHEKGSLKWPHPLFYTQVEGTALSDLFYRSEILGEFAVIHYMVSSHELYSVLLHSEFLVC